MATKKAHLTELKMRAEHIGIILEEDHIRDTTFGYMMEGYWLIDRKTREGPFEDDNFSTSLAEVESKILVLESLAK
jgi:hypothetical protein